MRSETAKARKAITAVGRRNRRFVPLLFLFLAAITQANSHDAAYLRLQSALELYLQIAEDGGWPTVPDGPTIEPGSLDPRVAALARRLAVTGDLDSPRPTYTAYDDKLEDAVRRFQARHGLEVDALVGRNTLRALNVSVEQRVAQLRLNLERSRQVFDAGLSTYLLVNVPAFEATLVRDGETVLTTKVIVGETEAETPLFEARMKHVVINPTWSVPFSIASKELLPKIQRDAGFLSRGGYDVFDRDGNRVNPVDVAWSSLHGNNFPYTLVQRPGNVNELGRIKFVFPNSDNIYMHHTPATRLFSKARRDFSHGCIRVEAPLALALFVLNDPEWDAGRIQAAMERGKSSTLRLREPLPVVIAYLTALPGDDGRIRFFPDLYGLDKLE